MTPIELASALAAYTEHRKHCPRERGRTFDAQGRERPCDCGLGELLRALDNAKPATSTDSK